MGNGQLGGHCQVCGLKIILLPRLRERTQLAQGQGGAWKKDDSPPPHRLWAPQGQVRSGYLLTVFQEL